MIGPTPRAVRLVLRRLRPLAESALAAATLVALSADPADADGAYEREILVAETGRVVVEADAALLLHAGGAAFELFDPEGASVPVAMRNSSPDDECDSARQTGLVEREDGWLELEFRSDGPERAHTELRFQVDQRDAGVRPELWAGDSLGQATRIAGEARYGLSPVWWPGMLVLEFRPVTADTFRVLWPATSESVPSEAELCGPAKGPMVPTPPTTVSSFGSFGGARRYPIDDLPSTSPLSALEIELAAESSPPTAYSVQVTEEGRWVTLAEGAWPKGVHRHRIDLLAPTIRGGVARVELFGGRGEAITVRWFLLGHRLYFEAPRSGRYRLVYPSVGPENGRRFPGFLPGASAALGPERSLPSDVRLSASGAPAPVASYAVRVPVPRPEGVREGSLVAIDLSAEMGRWIGPRGKGLRLLAGGMEIPYALERAPEPEGAVLVDARSPRRSASGESLLEFELEELEEWHSLEWYPLFWVRAPAQMAPFRRSVWLERGDAPEARGREVYWSCAAPRWTPCKQFLQLPPGEGAAGVGREARIRIQDGDAAPLEELSVEVERPRPRLLFVWPGAESVDVAAGAEELGAPSYDFSWLRTADKLTMAPYRIDLGARPEPSSAALSEAAAEPVERGILMGALVLLAAALGVFVLRLLPRRGEKERG